MGQTIFEFIHKGRYVKVSAIDAETGIEVSIVGDPAVPQPQLQELAQRKLQYVLNKNKHPH